MNSSRRTSPHERLAALTAREREVMTLAAEGKSNTEIAHHLVVIAYQTGLIRPPPPVTGG